MDDSNIEILLSADEGTSCPSEVSALEQLLKRDLSSSEAEGPKSPGNLAAATNTAGSSSDMPPEAKSGSSARRKGRKHYSGAVRKRIAWWMSKGKTLDEAKAICHTPLAEFPEYQAAQINDSTRAVKRPRTDAEPSSQEKPDKKARTKDPVSRPSFREIAGSVRVGIENSTRPMTTEEMEKVQEAILGLIDSAGSGEGPSFLGCSPKTGWLLLTCSCEATKEWLAQRIGNITPFEGARLRLLSEKDLPKPRVGIAWIPDSKMDQKSLLRRLDAQNKGLNVALWKVLNQKVDEKGQTVAFSLDDSQCEALTERDCKLFLNFGSIHIRIKPKASDGGTGGDQAEGGAETRQETVKSVAVPSSSVTKPTPVETKPAHFGREAQRSRPIQSNSSGRGVGSPTASSNPTGARPKQPSSSGRGVGSPTASSNPTGARPKQPSSSGRGVGSPTASSNPTKPAKAGFRGGKGGKRGKPVKLASLASGHSRKASRNPVKKSQS